MSLYYQDDLVTLYQGDCLQLDVWRDAEVPITDPPYGTQMAAVGGAAHKGGYGRRNLHDPGDGMGARIANDLTTETRDAALALWGYVKPALVFGSPRLPDPPMRIQDRLVWDKTRLGMNGGPWRYRHESIYVTPGFERVNDSASSILSHFPSRQEQGLHIHAKPLKLMLQLVAAAPPGTIADPFAGSGPTLVAAKQLGRPCIAVELEEANCELIATRLSLRPVDIAVGQDLFDFGGTT